MALASAAAITAKQALRMERKLAIGEMKRMSALRHAVPKVAPWWKHLDSQFLRPALPCMPTEMADVLASAAAFAEQQAVGSTDVRTMRFEGIRFPALALAVALPPPSQHWS